MKLKTSFDFDAAHRLTGYSGKCSRLHGHRWVVEVEVKREDDFKLNDIGILWDFTNVKNLEKTFDHKTILKDCKENSKLIKLLEKEDKEQVKVVPWNPTAENFAKNIQELLENLNPELEFKVTVWESPKSSCEVKE